MKDFWLKKFERTLAGAVLLLTTKQAADQVERGRGRFR
jgi:hypothetical protein